MPHSASTARMASKIHRVVIGSALSQLVGASYLSGAVGPHLDCVCGTAAGPR